jgi:hypothetical protein
MAARVYFQAGKAAKAAQGFSNPAVQQKALRTRADRRAHPVAKPIGAVTAWLSEHRSCWAGWPTTAALEVSDYTARAARLHRARFPFGVSPTMMATVDASIALLRRQHRMAYRRIVQVVGVD